MKITILRAAGGREDHIIQDVHELMRLLGTEQYDIVNLGGGRLMFLDAADGASQKPVNAKATELVHAALREIVGDVAVMFNPDEWELTENDE